MTLMTLVLTGTGAWTLENLRASLIERTDERLVNASQALAIQAAEQVLTPSPIKPRSETSESVRKLLPGSYYVQFFTQGGQEIGSPLAPSETNVPILPTIDEQKVSDMQGQPFSVPGTKSQWRVLALHVQDSDIVVAIGVPFDRDIDGISEYTQNTIVGIGMLALAIVAGVGYFAITNTFRPLKEIEETASRIADGDLSQRVPEYPRNTEVGRLSAALNTMLGHIEDSFDSRRRSENRIRQFVSDASHELRTPLVTIRGYAELYRQGAVKDPEMVGQAMSRIEAEAKRMGVLVEDLVTLARLDERRQVETGWIDLGAVVRDAAADAAAQAPDRDISFIALDGTDAKPVPRIYGAESKIRQVIVNLAGNAVRHTPAGTAIEFAVGTVGVPVRDTGSENDRVGKEKVGKDKAGKDKGGKDKPTQLARTKSLTSRILKREPLTEQSNHAITPDVNTMGVQVSDSYKGFPAGRVRFEVRDHGDGIDPEDVPRIFERFYRLDASRTRDTGGSGLGLSIVKAIVESHHGKISVQPTPGGGATFRVDLPIPPEEPRKEQQ
ncbi:HAMP domain-containing histidine kinase [Brevibacterium sp. ACRRH]|uniref:sensor histidine kinase n=1 Tax=Brevibacterium sp. ACRRH TaxID=2918183 RepID=UPI001EF52777|nr:HAMP domain-containing sensor histidine kinase [Brevibacterium sp. ACRRH]MCG7297699.1 HAMP domain-containing histidine kinase [Brevibacterium sp. ACRRH]